MNHAVELRQYTLRRGEFALRNVNLQVERGYITGLIGPNGAGKTTLIRSIMNLIKPDSGEVRVLGDTYREKEREIKSKIGFVHDEDHFYDHLTIREMKQIVASFYPTWRESAFQRYLRDFGLSQRMKVRDLSKGMKTKFALAAALAHEPELLIMDEPTSGLDPVFRREILNILSDYIADGNRSVLFSTHICADLERIADFIIYMRDGHIRFSGSKEELQDAYLLIKGPIGALTGKSLPFIGLQQSQFGFEGLLSRESCPADGFGDPYVIEKPTLDDIVIYTQRGK